MRVLHDAGINRFFILQRVHDRECRQRSATSRICILLSARQATPQPVTTFMSQIRPTSAIHSGLADYPQIGADQYGFYISVDEYYNPQVQSFVGAVIYAISKLSLASGAATPTAYKFPLPFLSGYEFAVQPATTPPGASYFIASGGIEYFASTVGSFSSGNSVSIWAMTNTSPHCRLAVRHLS